MQTSFHVVALLAGCALDGELVPKEGEPPPFDSAATVTLDTAIDSVPPRRTSTTPTATRRCSTVPRGRRFETRDHTSYTALEYPTVADIDGDGSAEILTVNNWGDHPTVIAYQHGGAGWPAAGPTGAVYDYAMTNLDADGVGGGVGRGEQPRRVERRGVSVSGPA